MDALIKLISGAFRASPGVETRGRSGLDSELVVTELHGKYYEVCRLGNIFFACMTAGVILPAPAATAANPFTLANPAGSGKNVVPISFDLVFTIMPGTPVVGTYGLYVNTNVVAAAVTGTAIVPVPGFLGSNFQPVAKPFSTATVPAAPTFLMPFSTKLTGAATTIPNLPSYHIDFDGRVILGPGSAITPQQTAADTTNATVICAMCWEEVPI
jgi:hypothetical protein